MKMNGLLIVSVYNVLSTSTRVLVIFVVGGGQYGEEEGHSERGK
jgi:hypothetical protein